jgi:hypothetical protein
MAEAERSGEVREDTGGTSHQVDESSPIGGTPSPSMTRSFQQFSAMFAGMLPRRDPLLEKLDADGVKQLLNQAEKSDEREHKRQLIHMYLMAVLGGAAMIAIIGLCWLFLSYQKSEQVEKIIALIVGLVGGFGVGRATASKGSADKD